MGVAILFLLREIIGATAIFIVGLTAYKVAKTHRRLWALLSASLLLVYISRGWIFGHIFLAELCAENGRGRVFENVAVDRYLFSEDELGIVGIDLVLSDLASNRFSVIEMALKRPVVVRHILKNGSEEIPGLDSSARTPSGYLVFFRGKTNGEQCEREGIATGRVVKLQKRHLNWPRLEIDKSGYADMTLPNQQCVGVVYSSRSTSDYIVSTFSGYRYPGVNERGVKIENIKDKRLLGGVFSYQADVGSALLELAAPTNRDCQLLRPELIAVHRDVFSIEPRR